MVFKNDLPFLLHATYHHITIRDTSRWQKPYGPHMVCCSWPGPHVAHVWELAGFIWKSFSKWNEDSSLQRNTHMKVAVSVAARRCACFLFVLVFLFGPILNDRLKEKIPKPWKGALSIHFRVFVWLCLCTRATDHSFWARNLIFGLLDPWNIRKKRIFLFFEIFIFTLFIGIFRFFSLYNTSIFFFVSSYWSQFFS